jgi:hypothetical protein
LAYDIMLMPYPLYSSITFVRRPKHPITTISNLSLVTTARRLKGNMSDVGRESSLYGIHKLIYVLFLTQL